MFGLTEHDEEHTRRDPEQQAPDVGEAVARQVPGVEGHVVACRAVANADAGKRSDGAGAVAERVDAGAEEGGRHDGRRPGGIE